MAAMVAAASKPKPVTTRHLAASAVGAAQLSKKQGLQMMEDLIGMITKHLKKGERVKIAGLGIFAGAQTRRPQGRKSGDRRADPDQGVQEGRLPRLQRLEDGDLSASRICVAKPRRFSGGFLFVQPLTLILL